MQTFVNRILSRLTQRPSSVYEWQMPLPVALPRPVFEFLRLLPDDEHETSYLAASARMSSFSMTCRRMAASPLGLAKRSVWGKKAKLARGGDEGMSATGALRRVPQREYEADAQSE